MLGLAEALEDRLAGQWPHSMGLCVDARPTACRVIAGRQVMPDGKVAITGVKEWRHSQWHGGSNIAPKTVGPVRDR